MLAPGVGTLATEGDGRVQQRFELVLGQHGHHPPRPVEHLVKPLQVAYRKVRHVRAGRLLFVYRLDRRFLDMAEWRGNARFSGNFLFVCLFDLFI